MPRARRNPDLPTALAMNQQFLKKQDRRLAGGKYTPLRPCMGRYTAAMAEVSEPGALLIDLTRYLVEARDETEALIRAHKEVRWRDAPERIAMSVVNSLRRSAGTNYQALVSYALARYLVASRSAWYLHHPVPKALTEQLAITFTGNVELGDADASEEESDDLMDETAEQADGAQGSTSTATVKPDIDILLRNEEWVTREGSGEPVVLLSVKTSLADRAGSAARWKLYFDLATNPCPHVADPTCTYRRLGIQMQNPGLYAIIHVIVTANIYKIGFHDVRYNRGELHSGQVRSNTYMFEHRYTSRLSGADTPAGWTPFHAFPSLLEEISTRHGLPIVSRLPT